MLQEHIHVEIVIYNVLLVKIIAMNAKVIYKLQFYKNLSLI